MNSASFLGLKRTSWLAIFGLFAGMVLASYIRTAEAKEKKDTYPDYTRLEYAKPLPPVDEQVKEPKPGSISRKFGERPDNPLEGIDPLTNIPVPLLQGGNKGNDFEPPITDILEATAQSEPAVAKSTAPAAAPAPTEATAPAASTETPKK